MVEEICNFVQICDRIATAGQPTAEQFAAIQQAGYKVVVNLALPTSTNALANEQELVQNQGMQYVHIPVIWENPTLADCDRFFTVMDTYEDRPIFVHCALNMRVSAFMFLYRRIREGMDHAEAMQTVERIWIPNQTWQTFINQALAHYLGSGD